MTHRNARSERREALPNSTPPRRSGRSRLAVGPTLLRVASLSLATAVGLSGTWTATVASASGISAPSVGTNRSSASHLDPAAIYWNPANLGFQLDRPQVMLGANLLLGAIRYTRDYRGVYQNPESFEFAYPIDPENIDGDKAGEQDNSSHLVFGPQPNFFLSYPVNDSGVVLGFGVYAPYAAIVNYPEDGAQRFAIQNALLLAVNFTPSIAYRVSDVLSIGAGVSLVLGLAELERVQDFASVSIFGEGLAGPPVNQANDFGDDAPTGVRELDVLARQTNLSQMWSTGFTFNAGGSLNFDDLLLSASYQHSVEMNYRGNFELDMDDDFFTGDLESQGLKFDPLVEGKASLSFTLPNAINTGIRYQVSDRVSLGANFSYTFWSTVTAFRVVLESPQLEQPDIGIPNTTEIALRRDWKNTIALDVHGGYWLSDRTELWANAGYHSNAVPDATLDPASPDGDRLIVGGGFEYQLSERTRFMMDAEVQHVLTRENVASDYDLGNGTYGLTLLSLGGHLNITLGKLADEPEHEEEIRTRAIPSRPVHEDDVDPEMFEEFEVPE